MGTPKVIYQQKEPLTVKHNPVWLSQHQQQLDKVFPDKETSLEVATILLRKHLKIIQLGPMLDAML